MSLRKNEIEFFRELRDLLQRYNVKLEAEDSGMELNATPRIGVLFDDDPFKCFTFKSIGASDDPSKDAEHR